MALPHAPTTRAPIDGRRYYDQVLNYALNKSGSFFIGGIDPIYRTLVESPARVQLMSRVSKAARWGLAAEARYTPNI